MTEIMETDGRAGNRLARGQPGQSSAKLLPRAQPALSLDRTRLQARLGSLGKEISSINASITELQQVRDALIREQLEVQQGLDLLLIPRLDPLAQIGSAINGSTSIPAQGPIDYFGDFEWDEAMKSKMTQIFGIPSFRLCQKG